MIPDFETELMDLIAKHQQYGTPTEDILTGLEIQKMALEESSEEDDA